MTVAATYISACAALKALAPLITAAEDIRYEAPPGMAVTRGEIGSNVADILNPTLDTVLDPRRSELSDEVRRLEGDLRVLTANLTAHAGRLDRAISRWEGDRK